MNIKSIVKQAVVIAAVMAVIYRVPQIRSVVVGA